MTRKLLTGQRALITGASSGIGRAIACAMADAGAAVAVNYRSSREEAEQVVQDIVQCGGKAISIQADVSKPGDCERLFGALEQDFDGVDVVVANAGIQRDAAFTDMTLDDWHKVLEVNLTGQFVCSQAAVRCFRRQGLDPTRSPALGKIIFTSSVHQAIP